MKTILLLLATTLPALAQVKIVTQPGATDDAGTSAVIIGTRDRQTVPLQTETQTTRPDDATTRTETVTRLRQEDGSYADWQTIAVTTRKLSETETLRTTEMAERDRQGRTTVRETTREEITRLPDGREQAVITTSRRNASGQLRPDEQQLVSTTPTGPGTRTTIRVEQRADVNGRWRRTREIEEQVAKVSDNETTIAVQVREADHVHGGTRVTGRETTTIRVSGQTTVTETRRQAAHGTGWRDEGTVHTTETRDPQGRRQRETIETGRSLYARMTGTDTDIVPKRKVIETEIRQPDGRLIIERQEYRRDVNGNWTPVTFSTETGPQRP